MSGEGSDDRSLNEEQEKADGNETSEDLSVEEVEHVYGDQLDELVVDDDDDQDEDERLLSCAPVRRRPTTERHHLRDGPRRAGSERISGYLNAPGARRWLTMLDIARCVRRRP